MPLNVIPVELLLVLENEVVDDDVVLVPVTSFAISSVEDIIPFKESLTINNGKLIIFVSLL